MLITLTIHLYILFYLHFPPLLSLLPPSLPPSFPPSRHSHPDTLHCNCEGPYNCNPANNSCVARKADDKPEIACLIYKEFRNTGETAEVSLCLAVDRTYYLLKCEPGRQVSGPRSTPHQVPRPPLTFCMPLSLTQDRCARAGSCRL